MMIVSYFTSIDISHRLGCAFCECLKPQHTLTCANEQIYTARTPFSTLNVSIHNFFIEWYVHTAATSVTIGLQETSYSVYETDEYQVVCVEVRSGDIAGRYIDIEYTTESDTAEGTYPHVAANNSYGWDIYTQKSSIIIISHSLSQWSLHVTMNEYR